MKLLNSVPEDWHIVPISNVVARLSNGLTYVEDLNGCDRISRIETISDKTINLKKTGRFSADSNHADFLLRSGDILYSHINSLSHLGKLAFFDVDCRLYHGMNLLLIRANEKIDKKYLFYILQSDLCRAYVWAYSKRAVAQSSLSIKDIRSFSIPLPPLLEQRKIAEILGACGEAIEAQQKLIELKEKRLKGWMQKLLTGKVRFPEFEGKPWKEMPLGDQLIYTPRKITKPSAPYLSLGVRSHAKGTFLKHATHPDSISLKELYQVKSGDVILNISFAWEHAIAVAQTKDDGALISHRFPTFVCRDEIANPSYFRHFVKMPRVRYDLKCVSPGGAGRNRVLNKKDFLQLHYSFPEYKEQCLIGEFLNAQVYELSLEEKKLVQLEQQKKSLMQKLLTGKVRVKVDGDVEDLR